MTEPRDPHDLADLGASWRAAWRDLALPLPSPAVFDAVVAAWAGPLRRYHTLQHLREGASLFADVRGLAVRPGEVALALWFHDAVYDTARHDNEAASADWARRVLVEVGGRDEVADRVHALVMATRHSVAPATADERLLVDIDLAILGADEARFAEYERQIRAEYAFVPDALFRTKRREVLQGFLDRDPIYATPALRDRLEAAARANLARATR